MSRRSALAAVAGVFALIAATPRANAYVRYRTEATNAPYYWEETCVPIQVFPTPLTSMPREQTLAAARAAAAAWSAGANACTYLELQVSDGGSGPGPHAQYDALPTIVFRTDDWCRAEDPTSCYDETALAITHVTAKLDGHIVDADIEVNAISFGWADLVADPLSTGHDLQNMLTHELGHFIGLDHSCYNPLLGRPLPVDDSTGQPPPDCAFADEDVRATTMFDSALQGDIGKRTLAADDLAGVCAVYPKAADPGLCVSEYAQPCTCTVASAPDGATGGGLALAAIVLAVRRRARPRA